MMSRNTIYVLVILLLISCTSKSPFNLNEDTRGPSPFNLGYEDLATDGTPLEWMLLDKNGTIDIITDKNFSLEGENCLHFTSKGNLNKSMQCLNTLITDIVNDSLTLSVSIMAKGNNNLKYGFFHQSQGIDTISSSTFIQYNQDEKAIRDNWHVHTTTITTIDLVGNFLVFGFWMEGEGEIWLDDWRLTVDNSEYAVAIEKRVPALDNKSQAYLRNASIPIGNQGNTDEERNYSWLPKAVEESNVVLLGEATHGTHEFAVLKTELTKYLVENMGFSTIVLEANLPEVAYLNEQLKKELNEKELMKEIDKLHFWMYRTNEFIDFLLWLRQYNATHHEKVQLTGCDLQYHNFAILELDRLLDHFPHLQLRAKVDSLRNPSIDHNSSIKLAKSIRKTLRLYLSLHAMHNDRSVLDRMIQYCTIIIDALTLANETVPHYFRDEQMSKNIEWLTKDSVIRKTIVWAHNNHVSNNDKAIGYWLSKRGVVGNTFSLGMTSGTGTYHGINIKTGTFEKGDLKVPTFESWEYNFKQLGIGDLFLDLRAKNAPFNNYPNRRMRSIGGIVTPKQFTPASLANRFDGIIYLDSTTATNFY